MSTATLSKPVPLTSQSALPPQPPQRLIDPKQAHLQAGLSRRDLPYLDAAPITARRKGQTFRGISIE